MLATVVFFAGAAAALVLPARTFLTGALDLTTGAFFTGGGLEALLVAVLVVFALVATALEAGLLEDLEAGLVGLF